MKSPLFCFAVSHNKTALFCSRRKNARSRGAAVSELISTFFVTALIMALAANLLTLVNKTAARQRTEAPLSAAAALSINEVTAQLRGGDQVMASQTLNGTTYTTSTSSLVVRAPSFNPATAAVKLSGINDYLVFSYDSSTKQLTETVVPGVGSVRTARTGMVLGKNVTNVSFAYRARDQYKTLLPGIYTPPAPGLSGTPTAAPTAVVNGVITPCTFSALSPRFPTVMAPAGADVEFMYSINPAVSADLACVSEINAAFTLSNTDATGVTRTVIMPGAVRLRNRATER